MAHCCVDGLKHLLLSFVALEKYLARNLVDLQHVKFLAPERQVLVLELKELCVIDIDLIRVGLRLVDIELTPFQV